MRHEASTREKPFWRRSAILEFAWMLVSAYIALKRHSEKLQSPTVSQSPEEPAGRRAAAHSSKI